jgi:uncharacterized repeat protein (TIGR03803 family)
MKRMVSAFVLCGTAAMVLPAQTFTTLHNFDNTDGAAPTGALVQGADGNLYGTTTGELGINDNGTVFKISTNGAFTLLHSFDKTDGTLPYGGLIQDLTGNFYGTTISGGLNRPAYCSEGCGTVFEVTANGTLTTLYGFCFQPGCTDGAGPYAGLVQAANGDFYGTTTFAGGSNDHGTVFKMTADGALTTLHSFCSQSGCTDGYGAYTGLIQAANGELYGTTYYGGANGAGTVYKITPSGTLTTLYSFCSQTGCADGEYPDAALVQAANGDLYGTTIKGGANLNHGTVFRITPGGELTTLYSFCSQSNCADGYTANGLIQATDGNFYGTTSEGGAYFNGTIFKITPGGALTTLYTFCSQSLCPDGYYPAAALVQATDGNFYGTAKYGGTNSYGTVFRLSVGLGPFVETQPTSGKVGSIVKILGTDLTGASRVTFNGTRAVFGVSSGSATEITTTVPAGATSGEVQVVTPGGTLSSNVSFRVVP